MRNRVAIAASIALVAPLVFAAPAQAISPPVTKKHTAVRTIVDGLVSPLSTAIDVGGARYVTENFAGVLKKVTHKGKTTTLYTAPVGEQGPNEVGGVSAFLGEVRFTETTPGGSLLKKVDRRGKVSTVADLGAHEAAKNPDGKTTYGITDLPASCAAQWELPIPVTYQGEVYSHPYATLTTPLGTVVADAGANAILTVDRHGKVRTLAVLPAQKTKLTEAAVGLGIPSCAVGYTYGFEAVPTDVELGPDGWLYVTLLPGGPEDASLGARGSVVKVNPLTGAVRTVVGGLLSATGLAVSPKGDIYIAELFANRISVLKRGATTPVVFRETVLPAAVEWTPRGILATTHALVGLGGAPGEEPTPPGGKLEFFRF